MQSAVPLLVLGVLAADDVNVFTALSAYTLQILYQYIILLQASYLFLSARSAGDCFRTLQPSHSFLTELRTFIPLVCWKATRLFVGDATGLASDICDILEMSELDEEVLKAVRAHTERGLRTTGAARSSERVVCANMVEVCCFTGVAMLCDESLFDNRMAVEMSTCRRFGGLARLKLPSTVPAFGHQHVVVLKQVNTP